MVKKTSRKWLSAMLLCVLLMMTGCKQNPSEKELYARMTAYFENAGYACSFADAEEECEVPIYLPAAWKKMLLDGEEVLVYFDESNRADYLSSGIDAAGYSFVGQFGMRFVLVYQGTDPGVLKALEEMPSI